MKPTTSLHEFMPYGAPDLIVAQRPHLGRALTVSSSSALLAFAIGLGALALVPRTPAPEVVIPRIDISPIREKLAPPMLPKIHLPAAPVRPADFRHAPPRLVPDDTKTDEIPEEYREYARQVQPNGGNPGGGEVRIDGEGPPAPPAVDPDLPVTVVDEWPVAVKEVKPEYPDIARQAMVDGKVVVLVLVGRDGRVREAKLEEKHHVPMLDEVALEAAKKWVFSPALVNGKPVSVWTAIPFDFVLE